MGVKAIEKSGKAIKVRTASESIETELVLLGLGVRPNTTLAKSAGINIGETGAIMANENMKTNIPRVYACGDCAEAYHRILKRNVWIPLGDTAKKQGRVAEANIAGEVISFPGIIGTSATKLFDLEVARTGPGEAEATREGFDVYTTLIESNTSAHCYSGLKPIMIKLIFEKVTRKLRSPCYRGEAVAKRKDI